MGALQREAHCLREAASYIGAADLKDTATKIEDVARQSEEGQPPLSLANFMQLLHLQLQGLWAAIAKVLAEL